MWTRFMDMHSGGGTKEGSYEYIHIEASEEQAKVIFYNRFGHNPERVSCTCCGDDYSISEDETLEKATEYDRRGVSLEDYLKRPDVLVIRESEIKDDEHKGDLPQQGFVWVG